MSVELIEELKARLTAEFAQTGYRKHPAEPERYEPPAIYAYAIPARRAQPRRPGPEEPQDQMAAEFPFIVLRPGSGEDGEADDVAARTESVEITFVCGVFTAGDEAAGAADLESMMGRVRRMLMRRRLYMHRWERELPITWDVGDGADHAQPHPFYGGRVRARFSAPAVVETLELDEEVRVYGHLES